MRPAIGRRAAAGVVLVGTGLAGLGLAGCGGSDDEPEGDPLPAEAAAILTASAQAMGDVTSVRFTLTRSGAPVYIDTFESLALESVDGRFAAPASADARADGRGRRIAQDQARRDRHRRHDLAVEPGDRRLRTASDRL